jgi:hypothetical protein
MAVGNVRSTSSEGDAAEVARLKAELAQTQKRLEEEVSYYRAEVEATRQRVQDESVRSSADEVSRRRRAEEQVLSLQADLADAEAEAERNRTHYEELARKIRQLETQSREQTRAEVEKVRTASKLAWRNAEEELEVVEQELSETRRLLAKERERVKQLEAAVTTARQETATAAGPDPESLRLFIALKKALWTTAEARRKAEMQLASLQSGEPLPAQRKAEPPRVEERAPLRSASRVSSAQEPGWQAQPLGSVDSELRESWQTLKVGELDEGFSDEFRLMAADTSLDRETFEQVQQLTAKPIPEPAQPARAAAATPAPVLQEEVWLPPRVLEDDEPSRTGRLVKRLLWLLVVIGLIAGGGYGLQASGLLSAWLG